MLESESTYGVVGCDGSRDETWELLGGLAGEWVRKLPSLDESTTFCSIGVRRIEGWELWLAPSAK